MAKVVDITQKLGMQGKPLLKIGDTAVEVDNTAKTMLRVLDVIGDDPSQASGTDVVKVYEMLFDARARKKLNALGLSFDDFTTVVSEAVDLVIGGDGEGEAEATPATTS